MTGDLSRKLEELFHAALELEPEQRARYAEEACSGDAQLHARLMSLLRHHDTSGGFLEEPVLGKSFVEAFADDTSELPVPEVPSLVGQRLGPYELRELIGSGGMGSIYLAERTGEDFRRRVAIKLIKRGMDSKEILRRFVKERQALARLDHPNIARLLDGGSTEDGQPYLVMEHIDGEPIDVYSNAHTLSTPRRLDLFLSVCSAVQYSHRNLIVHRDIKPGNILVTPNGTVKLLDFGIAKLLGPDQDSTSFATTDGTHRFLTLEYASPEQVRGGPITTATDVYSLGVVLYEILTGHRPYRVTRQLSPGEIEQVICGQEPPKPSTVIQRTEQVPSRDRKGTITLTPELVSSTRDGRPEKLRRNLSGDIDNIVLMALRKEPERRYESAEQFAEDIRRHLRGLPVLARKDTVLYRTAKFLRRNRVAFVSAALVLLSLVGGILGTFLQARRAGRERDQAVANLARARVAEERAQKDAILAERRRSWATYLFSTDTLLRVLDDAEKRIMQGATGPAMQVRLMENLADFYSELTLFKSAVRLREQILEIRRDIIRVDDAKLAESRHKLAAALHWSGDADAAIPHLREALEVRRRLSPPGGSSEVAESLHLLGMVYFKKQDYDRCLSLMGESLRLRRRLSSDVPHPDVVGSLQEMAGVLLAKGDRAAALLHVEEALELVRQLFQEDHPLVARVLLVAGGVLQDLGRYEEAEDRFRTAMGIYLRLLGEDHMSYLNTTLQLAVLLKDRARYDEAQRLADEVLEARQRLLDEGDWRMARIWWHHAQILADKGDLESAEASARRSLKLYLETWEPGHRETARVMALLGRILIGRGNHREAEEHLRNAVNIYREKHATHWEASYAGSLLGEVLSKLGRHYEAESLLVRSYPVILKNRGRRHRRTREALERIIELYRAWGKPESGEHYRVELETLEAETPARTTTP